MPAKLYPTKDQVETICSLATVGKSRQEIADAIGISYMALARWIVNNDFPEVKEAYLQAKQNYAHDLAEDIMRQATSPLHDDPKLASAEVQRRRLIVDTAKWISSKLLPKVYGDNLHINHAHSGKVNLSPLAQLRQLEHKDPIIDVKAVTSDPEAITEDDCF